MSKLSRVYSMTGFGIETIELAQCTLTLQLKSVNSRYLDLTFKIPDELSQHEALLRERISQRVKRGKIECKISWQAQPNNITNSVINEEALEQTLTLQGKVFQHIHKLFGEGKLNYDPSPKTLSVRELLSQPNVMPSSIGATNALTEITPENIETLITNTLTSFLNSRATEGAHLNQTLKERLNNISGIINNLRAQLPTLLEHQTQRLTERLFKAIDANKTDVAIAASAIPREELIERIKLEANMTAIRIDVAEELDRLDGHILNTHSILDSGSAEGVGKKLDFLMQEFNREANTLGSKSASLLQTQASMELKFIIEQMREQVQNIE